MSDTMEKGRLFIVSAPSGAGKSTLCSGVLNKFSQLQYSISHTTRSSRKGEVHGKDYYFISKEEFIDKIKADFWAEWAEVHGNYYGTSSEFIREKLANGFDILLDVDVQGAEQILEKKDGIDTITVFIMPPSMEILKKRLISRDTDSSEVINKRLKNAEKEILKKDLYDHIIINDDLSEAVKQFENIISDK